MSGEKVEKKGKSKGLTWAEASMIVSLVRLLVGSVGHDVSTWSL